MTIIQGTLRPPPGRFAIVAARFNSFIVEPLVAGARDAFERHGVDAAAIDVVYVPGSLEIPLVAKKAAESGRYVAVVACGAVVRGETDHYDVVVGQSAGGLAQASLTTGVPILNAVLTTDTVEQAINRAGAKAGNKGADAAAAAIEMVNLLQRLSDDATAKGAR
ncbi:MAG: 6,7-dimethyl-8-ribityllumazine synthase [Planctomycetia bacterium]